MERKVVYFDKESHLFIDVVGVFLSNVQIKYKLKDFLEL